MTPAEQDAIFDASIVRNLDDVPKESWPRCGLVSKRTSPVPSRRLSDRCAANGSDDPTVLRGSRSAAANRAWPEG
jgi:hypothetical protein